MPKYGAVIFNPTPDGDFVPRRLARHQTHTERQARWEDTKITVAGAAMAVLLVLVLFAVVCMAYS